MRKNNILFAIAFFLSGCASVKNCTYYNSDKVNKASYISTKLGDIFYRREGQGTPLIYLHGNLGTHKDFTLSPLKKLSESYSVIVIDRYGAGYSRRKEQRSISLEEHADCVAEVIDALELKKPIIMGHSYGGAVSLMFALRHSEKLSALTLLSPAAHDWEGEGVSEYQLLTSAIVGPILMETLFLPVASFAFDSALDAVFLPAEVPALYRNAVVETALVPDHFLASALDMQVVRAGLGTIAKNYDKITVPTVVVAGGQDTITPYWNHGKRLKEKLPRGEVFYLENAGHQVHFSHPDTIIEAIERLNEL